jgi:ribosomal protein S18 acetylase RimI-like enzyme
MTPEDQSRFPAASVTLKGSETVLIRPLAQADGPALADFYESVPPEDYRFYCPHPLDRENASRKAAGADDPLSVILVAESSGGRIAGYAWYKWKSPDAERSGFGICIRREFQGRGLGKALMARLNEIARLLGPPVMGLTVQKANPRAVALYREMGFAVVREQLRGGDGEPEFYMERKVR